FFWDRLVVSIYPGHAGVLWRRFGGTVIHKVYGEGTHVLFPLNIMYIYDVRWHVLRRSVTTLTRDGLEITVDLGLLYRVRRDLAGELHRDVGMEYVESLILPTLDSSARNIIGSLDVEKLYVEREKDVYTDARQKAHDIVEGSLVERAK